MKRFYTFPITLLLLSPLLGGCGLVFGKGGGAESSLREVLPFQDRDHFVYLWQRIVDGRREAEGVQIEHISALPSPHELEVTISEDGTAAGRMRLFYDGKRVDLLAEDDLAEGIRRTYDPPLSQLRAPLADGERDMQSRAIVSRIDDGMALAEIEVQQKVRVSHVKRIDSHLGRFDSGVVVEARRTLHTPDGKVEMMSAILLVPGIGEIRSEGTTMAPNGTTVRAVLRRELACAIVRNQAIGDCRAVAAELAAMRQDDLSPAHDEH